MPQPSHRTPVKRSHGDRSAGARRSFFSKRSFFNRHRLAILIPAGLAVFVLGLRLALTPVLRGVTRNALNAIPNASGSFDDIAITVHRLSYRILGVKISVHAPNIPTVIYAQDVEAHLLARDLLRLRLGGAAKIEHAKITVAIEPPPRDAAPAPSKAELPDFGGMLEDLIPFRVERLELRAGELLVVDKTEEHVPARSAELWLHHVEATFENFGTRRELMDGQATSLGLKAKVQRSGDLNVFLTADPLAKRLTFAGETSLRGLELSELYGFIAGKTNLQATKGTMEVFASFKCEQGVVIGGVKPVLRNVEIAPADSNLGSIIKAKLVDTGISLFSDRVPGRNAVTALIPIKGRVTDPKAELWPTVLSIVRNAYVEALASGFTYLPPNGAGKAESPVEQAARVLTRNQAPEVRP